METGAAAHGRPEKCMPGTHAPRRIEEETGQSGGRPGRLLQPGSLAGWLLPGCAGRLYVSEFLVARPAARPLLRLLLWLLLPVGSLLAVHATQLQAASAG